MAQNSASSDTGEATADTPETRRRATAIMRTVYAGVLLVGAVFLYAAFSMIAGWLADRMNKLEAANTQLQTENQQLRAVVDQRDAEVDYLKEQAKDLRQESAQATAAGTWMASWPIPPTTTATAIGITGWLTTGATRRADAIITRFSTVGDSAGARK